MVNRELLTESYNYKLDNSLIASYPIFPKEKAKLLVYYRDSDEIIHTNFGEFVNFIPKDSAIIFNDTKVFKARIFGNKKSGGKIELLLNKSLGNKIYSVFIKGKVRIGTILIFPNNLECKVLELKTDGSRVVDFGLNFSKLILKFNEIGHVPLPPYIKREDDKIDEVEYQSVFANKNGAVAAPTASLHFSKEMLEKLKNHFIVSYLTLHVGAGTFKPVTTEEIKKHDIHSEFYSIEKGTQKLIDDSNKKILAIGTTVTRTIEYYIRNKNINGEANIFLHLENRPKRVNYLLTNFHLPKSTLLMLVSSFIGLDKTLNIYQEAIKQKYRFFSYGDAMLIL